MRVTWSQALAWRMQRHLLEPVGDLPVEDVVRRLCAVPAWSGDPEVAVRVRRADSRPGEVAAAVEDGRLVKVYAFGGATHLMAPEEAGTYLALRSASRMWERTSWVEHYGLAPDDWPPLRAAVREAVSGGPLTREELATAVTARHPQFQHAFDHLSDTLLKPFTWQGDLCFGPIVGGEATFQALDHNPRWGGIPHLDDAGRSAVSAYLSAYGPATPDHLHYWLGEGLGAGRKRVRGWLADLADRLTRIDVDGESALILGEHADDLATTAASETVRLVAGHDQWVRGPGTWDPHVVPPTRRPLATRGANLVIAGGVVAGTWRASGGTLVLTWFAEAGPVPHHEVAREAERLAVILDRSLDLDVRVD